MNLIIIGNGFDIQHEFETKYKHFRSFCEKNHKEKMDEIIEYFPLLEQDWNEFENNLFYISKEKLKNDYIRYEQNDMNFSLFKYGYSYKGILTKIEDLLKYWIDTIDWNQVKNKKAMYKLPRKEIKYMNFNYTETLNWIYKIDHDIVFNIHNNPFVKNTLIVGHGVLTDKPKMNQFETILDKSYFVFDYDTFCKDALFKFSKKPVEIVDSNLEVFNVQYEKIYILGHSIGDSDLYYFEYLSRLNRNTKWIKFYYDDKDQSRFDFVMNKLNIANHRSFDLSRIEYELNNY